MASAVRVWVPLKTRCSMRWDMPTRPSGSCREPASTHTPTATDRTCSICSVPTRMPLGVGDDLHERAELDDLLDLTEVDPVELDLAADVLDYRDRPLDRRLVRREHGDPAVVLDVDLGARLLLDPPHDLAAGADDLADLLLTG